VDVNRQGIALLQYSKEELTAMNRLPLASEGTSPRARGELLPYNSGETTITTKSGDTIQVDVVVGPLTRPQDPRVMLFVRDITEKKRMQAQLLQAEKLTLMGRLAAGIAHEIRNPLAAVTLNLQYLAQKLGADREYQQTIEDMLEGSRRIETVIGNTLNLAKVAPPVFEMQQLNSIIDQVLRYVKIAMQQKRISAEARLDRSIPAVSVDPRQIQQVMINVFQNAIDASPEGSILTVTTTILVEARQEAAQGTVRKAVVEIRDRGQGIPPDQVKQIFESFRTTKAGGTGLGLALSKYIMDRHNAEIRIEPAVGGGTLVKLVFPLPG